MATRQNSSVTHSIQTIPGGGTVRVTRDKWLAELDVRGPLKVLIAAARAMRGVPFSRLDVGEGGGARLRAIVPHVVAVAVLAAAGV